VIAGRTITADDVRTKASVGMLSLLGLKLIWPGVAPQEAVGRYLELPYESPREVIGVVSDVRYPYLAPALPTMYVPISSDGLNGMLFAVRTAPGQNLTVADFERRFRQLGLKPKSVRVGVVTDNFSLARIDQTFRARLFAGFGFVAIALAIIGVYAVQSFTVAARRKEFGIRVSLGATPRHIRNLLIWETIRPAFVGVMCGLLLAYWASQFLQAFVYGVDARDPWTFVGVAALILVVAVAAVWVPARRASRADPASVLRAQ